MGSKFLIYDPEANPDPQLTVGGRYEADRDLSAARGTWIVKIEAGRTASVHSRDLCNKRDKPEPKLVELAAHVLYETAMLIRAHSDQALRTAYTAWFVHYRNLLVFFRGKGHDEEEACAQDFFEEPRTWHEVRRKVRLPSPPELVKQYEEAAHELAVHLSYDRTGRVGPAMAPSEELTLYIRRLLWSFLDSLAPATLRWFSEAALFQAVGPKPAA